MYGGSTNPLYIFTRSDHYEKMVWFGFMVFNATFNNISVISWRSVLLMEETKYTRETTDLPQVTDKLYHIMLYTSSWAGFELITSVVIGTDCIGRCKFIRSRPRPPLIMSLNSDSQQFRQYQQNEQPPLTPIQWTYT